MDPQAYQQLINRMAGQSGSNLETFFESHGLGDAYIEGYGKKDRINRALAAARAEGTYDAVLADAPRRDIRAPGSPWPDPEVG